jgi:hypothetical protein
LAASSWVTVSLGDKISCDIGVVFFAGPEIAAVPFHAGDNGVVNQAVSVLNSQFLIIVVIVN